MTARLTALLLLFVPALALGGTIHGRVLAEKGDPDGVPYVALFVDDGAPAPAAAQLGEKWLSFYPKVQVVPLGSTLTVANDGEDSHTVHGWLAGETIFNFASVPDAGTRTVRFTRPGVVMLTCDIHRSMRAYVVVASSAHAAVTGMDGRFTITGVPPGHFALYAWQPGDPLAGAQPGKKVATVDVGDAPVSLELILPPPPQRSAALAPIASVDDPDPPTPSKFTDRMQRVLVGWPRGPWKVIPLSIFAVFLGLACAAGSFRLATRRGWPKVPIFFLGCVAAIGAGLLVIVGLNGAVATGLGFGLFVGTAIFGALEAEE